MTEAETAVSEAMDYLIAFAMDYGLSVIGAIIILVVGWMAADATS